MPQAIELIHTAGGVAVWAHPFWDIPDHPEAIALATIEDASGRRAWTGSNAST